MGFLLKEQATIFWRNMKRFSPEKKYGLHGWFMRGGGKGWIDCKTGKPCGRKKGEKRKYPACRPTKAMCSSAMRKKRGRRRISWVRRNPVPSQPRQTYNDRPRSWEIAYEAPPGDGTLPPGWYAQGLGRTGFRLDLELYGPFKTKAKAQAMARKVDASFRKGLMDEIRRGLRPASDATSTKEPDEEAWAKWAESNKHLLSKNPRPPKIVARVACRGLAKRRIYKRGGTAVGVARARDLCNRKNIPVRSLRRMNSYFSRHRASRAENRRRLADPTSPARIADELWGGTPGWRWARKVLG